MSTINVTGKCHCGKISFTALIDPTRATICHCTDCQNLSGGAYTAVVYTKTITVSEDPRFYWRMSDSGRLRELAFCPNCATHLWGANIEGEKIYGIRLGTIEQRQSITLIKQVWCESALNWAVINDDNVKRYKNNANESDAF